MIMYPTIPQINVIKIKKIINSNIVLEDINIALNVLRSSYEYKITVTL